MMIGLFSVAGWAGRAGCRRRGTARAALGNAKTLALRLAVTQKEVDTRAESTLQRLKDEEYEARRSALDEIITERLMDAQAKAQGLSRDELLKREVDGKVAPPTKAEIKDLYDRNKDRVGGRSLAELTPDIERSIMQTRSAERAQAYLEDLRSKASVAVTLPQPRNDVPIPADARVMGPEKAPVTIVEFSDFQCPFCSRVVPTLAQIEKEYGDKVRVVFRPGLEHCQWPGVHRRGRGHRQRRLFDGVRIIHRQWQPVHRLRPICRLRSILRCAGCFDCERIRLGGCGL
jgi:hypothetical protein